MGRTDNRQQERRRQQETACQRSLIYSLAESFSLGSYSYSNLNLAPSPKFSCAAFVQLDPINLSPCARALQMKPMNDNRRKSLKWSRPLLLLLSLLPVGVGVDSVVGRPERK